MSLLSWLRGFVPVASTRTSAAWPSAASILKAYPTADKEIVTAFIGHAPKAFERCGKLSIVQIQWIIATIAEESSHFTSLRESTNYSAARLMEVWPSRFKTMAVANKYARNPKALAENVYGGRLGNGPEGSGDGYKYRGGGLAQLTGKDTYTAVGRVINLSNLVDHVTDYSLQADIVSGFYVWKGMSKAKTFTEFTKMWNGGLTNFNNRTANLKAIMQNYA